MVEIEKEKVFVKINENEAITSKRDLLESKLNFLNSEKNMKKFKELRRKELRTKQEMRKSISNLVKDINKITEILPQKENREAEARANAREKREKEKKSVEKVKGIDAELEEIKKRLAKLS